MLATTITTYVQNGLAQLLTQYQNKPNITALFTAILEQVQAAENGLFPLNQGRQVYSAVGMQLDNLGTLFNQPRNGLSDSEYLLFILGKIGELFSDSTTDRVGAVYQILLNSPYVQVNNEYPAAVGMLAASTGVDPSLVPIIYDFVQLSLGAGIQLDYLAIFDPTQAFAFAGGGGTALGFGDLNNPATGGEFGQLLINTVDFAFANTVPDGFLGFGDVFDPLEGGAFVSL